MSQQPEEGHYLLGNLGAAGRGDVDDLTSSTPDTHSNSPGRPPSAPAPMRVEKLRAALTECDELDDSGG